MLKAFERSGRWLLVGAAQMFAQSEPISVGSIAQEWIRRILVVRQDRRLGNLTLLIPLLRGIRRAFPRANITLLAAKSFAHLLRPSEGVDGVIPMDHQRCLRDPLALWRLVWRLRRERFDLAIDASHPHSFSLTSAALTRASGAPYRIGHAHHGPAQRFVNVTVPSADGQQHETELQYQLLRHLAPHVPMPTMRVALDADEVTAAQRIAAREGVGMDRPIVGIHLGGRGKKAWPAERFAALSDALIERLMVDVLVLWGPRDTERIAAFKGAARRRVCDTQPATVRRLAALWAVCEMAISTDTGPMHLADAVGVPTLAIFQRPNAWRYGPRGTLSRAIADVGGVVSVASVLDEATAMFEASRRSAWGRVADPVAAH
jgi:ADP-heptose:LPS heptosyltransferase